MYYTAVSLQHGRLLHKFGYNTVEAWHPWPVTLIITLFCYNCDFKGTEAKFNIQCGWYQIQENLASAAENARFLRLFSNPSWLTSERTLGHRKLAPTFPLIDNCLLMTK